MFAGNTFKKYGENRVAETHEKKAIPPLKTAQVKKISNLSIS